LDIIPRTMKTMYYTLIISRNRELIITEQM